MTVLLVDDETQILTILAETLKAAGIEARTFSCGEDALTFLADYEPEVLVSDLRMPGMNGLELLPKARSLYPDLQTVILTGFGDMKSAVEALRLGAFDYLNKPVDAERLVQTLKMGAERRRLIIENRTLIEHLKAANRMKTDFLHGMSHEIRTPLGHVTGFADILEQTLDGLTEKQVHYFNTIRGAANRLLAMFDDILQYADLGTGDVTLDEAPVALSDLIRKVQATLSDWIQKKLLHIAVQVSEAHPVVVADAVICEKILEVVIKNAVEFSPEHGQIDICAAVHSVPNVANKYRAELVLDAPLWLHLSVTDQGPGIAEEDQARIFNLFEQVDGSLARGHEGTGLGLALARSLAKRHNGVITLESAPGKGSTFTLVVPVSLPS